MNTPVKLLVGFGAVGGITGGSIALSSYLSQEDSIQKQLESEGFRILPKTDSEWDKIILSYKEVIVADSKLKFAGKDITNAKELQERCEATLNKNASGNNDTNNYLNQAKRWCIVPTKVSDKLVARKILVISKAEDKEDQEAWNDKVVAYTAKENADTIVDLKFTGTPIVKGAVKLENRQSFKEACDKLINKKSYEKDYEISITKSKTWCTVEKK